MISNVVYLEEKYKDQFHWIVYFFNTDRKPQEFQTSFFQEKVIQDVLCVTQEEYDFVQKKVNELNIIFGHNLSIEAINLSNMSNIEQTRKKFVDDPRIDFNLYWSPNLQKSFELIDDLNHVLTNNTAVKSSAGSMLNRYVLFSNEERQTGKTYNMVHSVFNAATNNPDKEYWIVSEKEANSDFLKKQLTKFEEYYKLKPENIKFKSLYDLKYGLRGQSPEKVRVAFDHTVLENSFLRNLKY